MKPAGHRSVPENRPVRGFEELEALALEITGERLDILDQHFRGRAVGLVEAVLVGTKAKVRVLMAPDNAWNDTIKMLRQINGELRNKRLLIRAWPESSQNQVPWHYRGLIGDRGAWECSHSLDGVGKKATTFTNKAPVADELKANFERWWRKSGQIFPPTTKLAP
jgi:hypothetical protein